MNRGDLSLTSSHTTLRMTRFSGRRTACYCARFATERSEVRILSPRPLKSIVYGCNQWRPYFICGQFVDRQEQRWKDLPFVVKERRTDSRCPYFSSGASERRSTHPSPLA